MLMLRLNRDMPQKRKNILFVDDDANLLELIQELMSSFAGESWQVFTAFDVSRALTTMQRQTIDILVVDLHMPVVNGLQFLILLKRKYPNVLKVVLTADPSDDNRAACLASGAELFLEKPTDDKGWKGVYTTLDKLVRFQPEEGFRGVLRRVGLQDVLQMECLARNSSVLNIRAGEMNGQVFVQGGEIVHAQTGDRSGETAFNELMRLAGGEFELQTFTEPPARTIEGQWEFLLMEAARKRDEASGPPKTSSSAESPTLSPEIPEIPDLFVPPTKQAGPSGPAAKAKPDIVASILLPGEPSPGDSPKRELGKASGLVRPQIEEVLFCSLQGEVLQEWQCANPSGRISFLEFLSQKARQLGHGLALGEFDRLEVNGDVERLIVRIQPEWAVFARIRKGVENQTDS
jgi:CheY-like chemotaxis protein